MARIRTAVGHLKVAIADQLLVLDSVEVAFNGIWPDKKSIAQKQLCRLADPSIDGSHRIGNPRLQKIHTFGSRKNSTQGLVAINCLFDSKA